MREYDVSQDKNLELATTVCAYRTVTDIQISTAHKRLTRIEHVVIVDGDSPRQVRQFPEAYTPPKTATASIPLGCLERRVLIVRERARNGALPYPMHAREAPSALAVLGQSKQKITARVRISVSVSFSRYIKIGWQEHKSGGGPLDPREEAQTRSREEAK